MNVVLKPWQTGLLALTILGGQFIASKWVEANLENSIKAKYDIEQKAKERAEKVAEYMALLKTPKKTLSEEDYRKANQLSWELAMWLPSDIYKSMAKSMTKPDAEVNPLAIVISVRKELLGNTAGNLTQNDIIVHGAGIGGK